MLNVNFSQPERDTLHGFTPLGPGSRVSLRVRTDRERDEHRETQNRYTYDCHRSPPMPANVIVVPSTAGGLDDDLTIGPDGRFVLPNPDPLVDAMHALEIA